MKNCGVRSAECGVAGAPRRIRLRRSSAKKLSPDRACLACATPHSALRVPHLSAFTIIEVLTVMTLILILAGIVIGTYGYVNNRGARARAEGEIAALGAACENYKLDWGDYPHGPTSGGATDTLDAVQRFNPDDYKAASKRLHECLSKGYGPAEPPINPVGESRKNFFSFRPAMLGGTRDASGIVTNVDFIRDPWGNAYGYSTIRQAGGPGGFNPTFDLWSTAGNRTNDAQAKWVRNW